MLNIISVFITTSFGYPVPEVGLCAYECGIKNTVSIEKLGNLY